MRAVLPCFLLAVYLCCLSQRGSTYLRSFLLPLLPPCSCFAAPPLVQACDVEWRRRVRVRKALLFGPAVRARSVRGFGKVLRSAFVRRVKSIGRYVHCEFLCSAHEYDEEDETRMTGADSQLKFIFKNTKKRKKCTNLKTRDESPGTLLSSWHSLKCEAHHWLLSCVATRADHVFQNKNSSVESQRLSCVYFLLRPIIVSAAQKFTMNAYQLARFSILMR